MKRNSHIVLILTLLLSVYSCVDTEEKGTSTLFATDTLKVFGLDKSTSNVSDGLQYFFDENSVQAFLFSLSSSKNEIQVFNFQTGLLVERLTFEAEGPAGVGSLSSFYVHRLDSVLLFPNSGNRLFITDAKKRSIQRIDYNVPDGYGNATVSSTFFSARPFLKNGKLLVKTLYQGNYSTISNDELSVRHTSYMIDLKSGETSLLDATFPDDYWSDVRKHFQFSFTATESGMAYSFWGDHNIYFSKPVNSPVQAKPARSEALSTKWEALPLGGDRINRTKYFATSAHYGNLIYDPYREVYYRFSFPKVEIENETDLRLLARFPTKYSIMILSKDMIVLGEQEFSKNSKSEVSNVFVGKEGLYISVNHPESEENKEDFLSFRLYKLQ
ncbi:DUF4221 family protein [Roseivirga sp.]|uniref:DUF4221 family protein n=1 Tax=Roseivirga sp. TaxID=1964215 RepID=UPI003B8EAA6B